MDRDAVLPPPPFDVVPPVRWETARQVGLAGAGLAGLAAALGLVATLVPDGGPWVLSTARLVLVFLGAVTAGLAVSFRPDRTETWAIGATTAALAIGGTPAHWDSFRMLFVILTGIGVARLVLTVLPPGWRVGAVSAVIVFHFAGIFLATVSPSPTPWLVEQVYHRVYSQYLQFIYMRNAYHFYSPEPGPASLLACLLETRLDGETETTADGRVRQKYAKKWIVLPKRPADIRDPLGLTYYRRLSLTDQVSRGVPDLMNAATFEKSEIQNRRGQSGFPYSPNELPVFQYRLPTPEVSRFLLPSYAEHLILENTADAATAARTTLRIYRLEHKTLGVQEFTGVGNPGRKPTDPYHPTTYRPYFLGEFDALGRLVDPKAEMLYWLVPVIARQPGATATGDAGKDYDDHMSVHAGFPFDWRQLR